MRVDMTGLLAACSYALDCVETELLHVTTRHGKRVAYMSVCMAEKYGISGRGLQDLAACALLHDNALTQYISEEFHNDLSGMEPEKLTISQVGLHCIYGEENIKKYPFFTDVTNVILYHHENADGTGPFKKTWEEVPLYARIIHLCDMVDAFCRKTEFTDEDWKRVKNYLTAKEGKIFDSECVRTFFEVWTKEKFLELTGEGMEEKLWEKVPKGPEEYSYEACREVANLFAKIIDYKSEFTSRHSLGVAAQAEQVARSMGFDEETVQKMYLAGAFHDIGKIVIGNEILEKPDRLTDEEFAKMKNHAGYTYMILSQVEGFEEIRDWAAFHHERLDGTGYPFGKTAGELNTQERILACVDIYQALTEDRPYKAGMTHEKACAILKDMAGKGWIDATIVEVIEREESHEKNQNAHRR